MRYRNTGAVALAALPIIIWACKDGTTAPREAHAASLATAASGDGTSSGRVVTNYTFSGDYADYHNYDPAANGYVNIWVGQGGSGGAPEVWVNYDVGRCGYDPATGWYSCTVSQAGYGTIPNGDLSGNGANHLRLTTDTRSNPRFTVWAGTGGVIDLEWRKSGLYESSSNSVSESRFLDSRWKSNGSYSSASAIAQGTIIGIDVTGAAGSYSSGSIGSSKQHYQFMSK
jgi:hypothetical protein